MLFEKFPNMAHGHLNALVAHKIDVREFEQRKELTLLQERINAYEAERKAQALREDNIFGILKTSVEFNQHMVMQRFDTSDELIVSELKTLREAIERLARGITNSKTQEFLLNRIEGKS